MRKPRTQEYERSLKNPLGNLAILVAEETSRGLSEEHAPHQVLMLDLVTVSLSSSRFCALSVDAAIVSSVWS